MAQSPELPRKLMLLISAIQGILLLYLYDATESGTWPSQSPLWNYPLWLVSVAIPVLLLLTVDKGREIRAAKLIGGFGLVLVPIGIHIGWQASPHDEFPVANLIFVFVVSMGLACFKALMYLQQRVADQPMSYNVLFTYSWRNALTLALSLILVLAFWLILVLWGELFRAIEVDFFHDLFEQTWFLFPVLSLAHGVGVIIFRNLTHVIDSITRLAEGLIKILLPLAAVVSVVFISALPFVGIDALWDTGRGTSLLLGLLAVILFFTNAVYQDGRGERPYPVAIHRTLYAALLTAPVISALSFYGLYLRLEEYGWTVIRGWAFVVWLVLTLFSIGYVFGIVRKRDDWTTDLARVNTGMGLFVMIMMLFLNSPVLDLRKLSLNSQANRVESGLVKIEDFDFWYAKHSLGRPGYLFMEEKKSEIGNSDAKLLKRITDPVNPRYNVRTIDAEEVWASMVYRPNDFAVPDDLRDKINSDNSNVAETVVPVLIRIDLNHDQVDEYVLLFSHERRPVRGNTYYYDDGFWKKKNLFISGRSNRGEVREDQLGNGELALVPHQFDMLEIGDYRMQTVESN